MSAYGVVPSTSEEKLTQQGIVVKPESAEAVDVEVDAKTESVAPSPLFSERTWTESEIAEEQVEQADRDLEAVKLSDMDAPKVLYSDRISDLTEDEVYNLIENSNHGEYALDTFIPVRRDTPPLLVELSKKKGLVPVKNLPIIMNVEHIQQCMDEEVAANDGKRGHALTTENIIDIVKGLDNPRYVFFQKDNKRYCEVVEYDVGTKGEKALAIVTYTGNKKQDLMNGFPGREYNILVTAYPPDAKYWRDYQKSSNNILIYDKTKDAPQGSYGSHVPSLLSGSPFATNKVTQPDSKVKKFSLREPVEEHGDLIAMHNLSAEKLLKTIRLGGMPMPSIAVMKSQMPHTDYGEISVLYRKDTVSPDADSWNKVYGGGVWTPTVDQADTEGKDAEAIVEAMKGLGQRMTGYNRTGSAADLMGNAMAEYGSMDQIRADRGRLMEDYDFDAYWRQRYEDDLPAMMKVQEIQDELAGPQGEALELAYNAMMESARGSHTAAAIRKTFREFGIEITSRQAQTLRDAYEYFAQYPTPYFEAKPERVVRPDEWALVAVPDDVNPELVQELESQGVPVAEYRPPG